MACTYANDKYYVLDSTGNVYTMTVDEPLQKVDELFPVGDRFYEIDSSSSVVVDEVNLTEASTDAEAVQFSSNLIDGADAFITISRNSRFSLKGVKIEFK